VNSTKSLIYGTAYIFINSNFIGLAKVNKVAFQYYADLCLLNTKRQIRHSFIRSKTEGGFTNALIQYSSSTAGSHLHRSKWQWDWTGKI
jgi:hypothetical protein